jgi:hypothetical protein
VAVRGEREYRCASGPTGAEDAGSERERRRGGHRGERKDDKGEGGK